MKDINGKVLSSIRGSVEQDGVMVRYWSEYRDDWKTMYFKVDNVDDLKAIKGLRRNNNHGYYTARVVGPFKPLQKIFDTYSA